MISDTAVLEVDAAGSEVARAVFRGEGGEVLGRVVRSATHARSFWEGLGVDPVEFSCAAEDGEFLWRLYSARRGLHPGLELSMAETDEEAAAWAEADDPLWTVGRLGREHLPEPQVEAEGGGDARVLFFRLTQRDRARFRLQVEGGDGELWGTLEPVPGGAEHRLRRWDGRELAAVALLELDHSGAEVEVTPLVGEGVDLLELSAVEAIGLALVVLLAE